MSTLSATEFCIATPAKRQLTSALVYAALHNDIINVTLITMWQMYGVPQTVTLPRVVYKRPFIPWHYHVSDV